MNQSGFPFFVRIYGSPSGTPLDVSFEHVAAQLSLFANLHFEMDGSFVWVADASSSDRRWQLDGMIYDAVGLVQYVELKGTCSREAWGELKATLLPSGTVLGSNEEDDVRLAIQDCVTSKWYRASDFEISYLVKSEHIRESDR